MNSPLFQGVASEILAGIIVLLVAWLYRKYAFPFIKSLFIPVPNVAGHWSAFDIRYDKDNLIKTETGSLEIRQYGTRIKAVGRLRAAGNTLRIFNYEGSIASGQLVLNFEERKGQGYNVGSMILALSSDLNQLVGKTTYYHKTEARVVTKDKLYQRTH